MDEFANAHPGSEGTAPARRLMAQQINRAYVLLVASQFQGFSRDLHSECVDHILAVIAPPLSLRSLVRAEFTRGRQLDRGNAQSSSLGADLGRLGIDFWEEMQFNDPASFGWKANLDLLVEWRNAIAHQDFTSSKLAGKMNLQLFRSGSGVCLASDLLAPWTGSCANIYKP